MTTALKTTINALNAIGFTTEIDDVMNFLVVKHDLFPNVQREVNIDCIADIPVKTIVTWFLEEIKNNV